MGRTYEDKIKSNINEFKDLVKQESNLQAIKLGQKTWFAYNDKMSNEQKFEVLYMISLVYKKSGLLNDSLRYANESKKFICGQRYSCLLSWLLNELDILLGIDIKDKTLKRYLLCSKYFKSIGDNLNRAQVLYNIAKYNGNKKRMFMVYKLILKEYEKDTMSKILGYENISEVLEILTDFKNISNTLHSEAKAYLNKLQNKTNVI